MKDYAIYNCVSKKIGKLMQVIFGFHKLAILPQYIYGSGGDMISQKTEQVLC